MVLSEIKSNSSLSYGFNRLMALRLRRWYVLLVACIIPFCGVSPSSAASSNPSHFTVKGEVHPLPNIARIFERSSGHEREGALYVVLHGEKIETVQQIKNDVFEVRLQWELARQRIMLRAIYPTGVVSNEDIEFVPVEKFQDSTRCIVKQKIILTSVEDRFNTEKTVVSSLISERDSRKAIARLDTIEKYFMPPDALFYFILNKLRADVLYEGFGVGYSFSDTDIEKVYEIEQHEFFKKMPPRNRFNIYLQFGRALQRCKAEDRKCSSGRRITDVMKHCMEMAVSFQTANELRSEGGWNITSEFAEALLRQGRYDETIIVIENYFFKSEFPNSDLSVPERKAVVNLLLTYGLALSALTERLSYLEAGYIRTMASDPTLAAYWAKYGKLLQKWWYLYHQGSSTKEGRSLHAYLSLFKEIERHTKIQGDKS